MKVTGLKTWVVGNPPPGFGGRYFVFLKLVTDNGIEGVGEAYAATFDPKVVVQMIEDVVERHVIGTDPFRIEALWRKVYGRGYSLRPDISLMGVMSAVEMALWDIVGKAVDKPVYELLGGLVHERLRSYTYIYPQGDETDAIYADPDLSAQRAAEYVTQGFTAVKFDPAGRFASFDPRQPSLERLELSETFCRKLREAVGGKADLLFGTHGQFTVSGAIRLGKRLEKYEPLWFEEPVPPEMPEEMAAVARAVHIPVATGERLTTKYEFARVLETRRRLDPADEPRPGRRAARGQEDRRHGRDPLRPDRPAPLLRAGRRCRQPPARRLLAQLPDPGEHPRLGRLPRARSSRHRSAGRTAT